MSDIQEELMFEEVKDSETGEILTNAFAHAYNEADSKTRLMMLEAMRKAEEGKLSLEERARNLEIENSKLREELESVAVSVDDLKSRFESLGSSIELGNMDPVVESSAPGFLQHMKRYTSNELNSMGLIGTDNLFRLFHSHFIDPYTDELIQQYKFRAILKTLWQIEASTHELPQLKTETLRNGHAGVFAVFCQKVVPSSARKEEGPLSPSYEGNDNSHVRPQIRYTWKGIRYLISKWESLVKKAYEKYEW